MGDDRTDAEAFAIVRTAREAGRLDGLALAVLGARETPPEIHETSDARAARPGRAPRAHAGRSALSRGLLEAGRARRP